MEALASHFVDSPVGRQHYLAAGCGQPLLILHGLGAIASTWSVIADGLTESYRVLIPDLPGHGMSEPLSGDLSFTIELSALESIIHAECTEPAILLGHSLGAWLACLLSYSHPEFISRVVLVNGPILTPWPEGLSMHPANRDEAARLFSATSSSRTPPPADAMLDAYLAYVKVGPIGRFTFDLDQWKPYFLNDRLHQFPRPVDLLWGMEDELVTFQNAEILLANLPRVRAHKLDHCGHLPHFDDPALFLEVLTEILSQPAPQLASGAGQS